MAELSIRVDFDAKQLAKLFRAAQDSVFLTIVDDFPELDETLNINRIREDDE